MTNKDEILKNLLDFSNLLNSLRINNNENIDNMAVALSVISDKITNLSEIEPDPKPEIQYDTLPVELNSNNPIANIKIELNEIREVERYNIKLSVHDPDIEDEGELIVNEMSSIRLFPKRPDYDNKTVDINIEIPTEYLSEGDNIFQFKWLNSMGYTVNTISVNPVEEQDPLPDPDPEIDPPASDRIIYVSPNGDNNNDGLTKSSAVKTPDKGKSLIRDNSNDQLLFERGHTYIGGLGNWEKSGKSKSERLYIGAYGTGHSPIFETQPNQHFLSSHGNDVIKYVTFENLIGYPKHRDPSSDIFTEPDGSFGIRWNSHSDDIEFKSLEISYYFNNINIGKSEDKYFGEMKNILIDKCYLHHAYYRWDKGHAQGLSIGRCINIDVKDTVFYHNGWHSDVYRSSRTGFNHNLYEYQSHNVTIEGCVFYKGSNLGTKIRSDKADANKNIKIINNIYVENLSGVSAGSDSLDGDQNAITTRDILIQNNIFHLTGGRVDGDGVMLGTCVDVGHFGDALIADNQFVEKGVENNWYAVNIQTHHPYNSATISNNQLSSWITSAGGDKLINKRNKDRVYIDNNIENNDKYQRFSGDISNIQEWKDHYGV